MSDKGEITNKITLADGDETVIADDQLISKELNQFFQDATNGLYTGKLVRGTNGLSDPVNNGILKYRNYLKNKSKRLLHLEIYHQKS